METVPNHLKKSLLSSLAKMMLLYLVFLLEVCESFLHRCWSSSTTQEMVGDVGVVSCKDICRSIEELPRRGPRTVDTLKTRNCHEKEEDY